MLLIREVITVRNMTEGQQTDSQHMLSRVHQMLPIGIVCSGEEVLNFFQRHEWECVPEASSIKDAVLIYQFSAPHTPKRIKITLVGVAISPDPEKKGQVLYKVESVEIV
jgi:hypothetical protein